MRRWSTWVLFCASGAPGARAFSVPLSTEPVTLFDSPVSASPSPVARTGERWDADFVFRLLGRSDFAEHDVVVPSMSAPWRVVAARAPAPATEDEIAAARERAALHRAHWRTERELAGLRRDVVMIKERLAEGDSVFLGCLLFGATLYLALYLCGGCCCARRGAAADAGAVALVRPPFPVIVSKSVGPPGRPADEL